MAARRKTVPMVAADREAELAAAYQEGFTAGDAAQDSEPKRVGSLGRLIASYLKLCEVDSTSIAARAVEQAVCRLATRIGR